jgi:rod shape-determining protein MreB
MWLWQEKLNKKLDRLRWSVGIDLGTGNTLIYLKERGIVVNEPTMISRRKRKRWTGLSAPELSQMRAISYGYKAKEMLNREPATIEVVSPIKSGCVADLEALEKLMSYFLKLVYEIPSSTFKVLKPKVLVSIPSFVNQVNKRAIKQLFKNTGAEKVELVEQPVLAALGLGLSADTGSGLVIVDVGAGKTEVSVVSMGGIVVGKNIFVSGGTMDFDIVNYIKMKYGLFIGTVSAEKLKINCGGLVRGRDLETGLPKSVKISEGEIAEAIGLSLGKIALLVVKVLDETPPELMDDILKKGIVLVGGGAKTKGLARLIEDKTKISCRVADEPNLVTIKGCGSLL